jgi:hypothetical protein
MESPAHIDRNTHGPKYPARNNAFKRVITRLEHEADPALEVETYSLRDGSEAGSRLN